MTADEWDALDSSSPTPTPTPSRELGADEWDALDAPASAPMPRDKWDALDTGPTSVATPAPEGALMSGARAVGDVLSSIPSGVTKENAWKYGVPIAVNAATAAATGGFSVPVQMAANVATGAGARYLVGEDPLDKLGLTLDLAAPGAATVVRSVARGLSKPAASTLAGYEDAIKPATNLTRFPEVEDVAAAARTLAPESAMSKIRRFATNAQTAAQESTIPELRDIGDRLESHVINTQRFERGVDEFRQMLKKLTPEEDLQVTRLIGNTLDTEPTERAVQAAVKGEEFYRPLGKLGREMQVAEIVTDPATGKPVRDVMTDVPFFAGPEFESKATGIAAFRQKLRDVTREGVFRGRRQMESFPRRGAIDPDKIEMSALKRLDEYERRYKPIFASTSVGGPTVDPSQASELAEYGRDFNRLLAQIAEKNPQGKDLRATRAVIDALNDIYRKPRSWDPLDYGVNALGKVASKAFLPINYATQAGQLATPIINFGVGNQIEGLTRYIADPSYRTLMKASVGIAPGTAGMLERMGAKGLSSQLTGKMERGLRTWGSAGAIPYAEDVLGRAAARHAAGTPFNAALTRQLGEIGASPADWATTPTADILGDLTAKQIHRTQFNSMAPGQAAPWMTSDPKGQALTQWWPFGLDAARLARSRLVRPITQGTKTLITKGDPSDLWLGLTRAARIPGAIALGGGIRETMKAAHQMRAPDYSKIPYTELGTTLGTAGDVAGSIAQGWDPGDRFIPPAFSLLRNLSSPVGKGGDVNVEFLRALLGFDPTGISPVFAPPFLEALKRHKQESARLR